MHIFHDHDRGRGDPSGATAVLDDALKTLAKGAREFSAWIASPTVASNLDTITEFALITVALLLPAAVVRSLRESSWMPAALAASGLFAGLVALPVTIWLAIGLWYLYRLGMWLLRIAQIVAEWVSGVMLWLSPYVGLLMLVAAVGWGVYWLIRASALARVVTACAATVVAVVWLTDLLDSVWVWLGEVLEPVVSFLGMILGWLVVAATYIVMFVLYAFIILAAVGLVVALFGTIGRVSVLSVTGAWESGRGAQKVTDLSAGVGLTLGTVLLAASMERSPGGFGPWLEHTWHATPVVGFIPPPVNLMDLLVPDMAERYLVTFFTGFYPAIDILLLLLVCLVGALSLVLRSGPWDLDDGQRFRVAFPVMMAVGLALVFALPLVLMALVAQDQDG
jgi:hypothetical protein